MRVTNSMMVSNYLGNLNTNLSKLSNLQQCLARNRKFAYISDDPVSVIYSLEARYRLNRLENYVSNVQTAKAWTTQAETAVSDINEILKSAYESVIDAATNVKTSADRQNMAQYILQLRDAMLNTLNSTYGQRYLFGGYNTTGSYADGSNGSKTLPFYVATAEDAYWKGWEAPTASIADNGWTAGAFGIDSFDVGTINFNERNDTDYKFGHSLNGKVANMELIDTDGAGNMELRVTVVDDFGDEHVFTTTAPQNMSGTGVPTSPPGGTTTAIFTLDDGQGNQFQIEIEYDEENGIDLANLDQLNEAINGTSGFALTFDGGNSVGHQATDENGNLLSYFNPPVFEGDLFYNGVNLSSKAWIDSVRNNPSFATEVAEWNAAYAKVSGDTLSLSVGAGIDIDITFNGAYLVSTGGTNLYDLLNNLYKDLMDETKDVADIQAYITPLQTAQQDILALEATLGGRTNRLEMLENRYELDNINYTLMKSLAEDASESELIMNFQMALAVYQAALAVGSYIITPTLMDYMR